MGKYYHSGATDGSLGVLDYICQGNETEQKLSNIMLLERILHVRKSAPIPQAETFSCMRKWGKSEGRDAFFLSFFSLLVCFSTDLSAAYSVYTNWLQICSFIIKVGMTSIHGDTLPCPCFLTSCAHLARHAGHASMA